MALVIASIGVALVLEADVGTTQSALSASRGQLAALLANEILAMEVMGEMPKDASSPIQIGPQRLERTDDRFVDPDSLNFPYRNFEYEVIKRIQEIDQDTDLSVPPDRLPSGPYGQVPAEGEEAPKTVEVVYIRVTVRYPLRGETPTGMEAGNTGTITLETYVFDTLKRSADAPSEGSDD